MKSLKLKTHYVYNPYDTVTSRIIAVCQARGYEIDAMTAQVAWESYSSSMGAGWLIPPESDEELFQIILGETDAM